MDRDSSIHSDLRVQQQAYGNYNSLAIFFTKKNISNEENAKFDSRHRGLNNTECSPI